MVGGASPCNFGAKLNHIFCCLLVQGNSACCCDIFVTLIEGAGPTKTFIKIQHADALLDEKVSSLTMCSLCIFSAFQHV